ncbi:hypothetical protein ADUPG1_009768, partial [Aduncisulcus paluster]
SWKSRVGVDMLVNIVWLQGLTDGTGQSVMWTRGTGTYWSGKEVVCNSGSDEGECWNSASSSDTSSWNIQSIDVRVNSSGDASVGVLSGLDDGLEGEVRLFERSGGEWLGGLQDIGGQCVRTLGTAYSQNDDSFGVESVVSGFMFSPLTPVATHALVYGTSTCVYGYDGVEEDESYSLSDSDHMDIRLGLEGEWERVEVSISLIGEDSSECDLLAQSTDATLSSCLKDSAEICEESFDTSAEMYSNYMDSWGLCEIGCVFEGEDINNVGTVKISTLGDIDILDIVAYVE